MITVLFRKEKEGDIIAVFPYVQEALACLCYTHFGQHFTADWLYLRNHTTQEGIVIVAEFDGDIMVNLHTNWCFYEGHFEPNNRTWSAPIRPTHWMSYADYRKALETLPRE